MSFDLQRPLQLDERVALRPEAFGALAYHFETRRLTFIKTRKLLAIVESLGREPSGLQACVDAGVADAELPAYGAALARLAEAGMIEERAEG